jgi:ribose transport system permease protein
VSGSALASAPSRHVGLKLARHSGLLVALAVFLVLFAITDLVSAGSFNYFELSFLSSGGATLAIAAIGETLVVLSGGFDLSAGAVISLVNVVLAGNMQDDPASMLLWSLAGIGVGAATGLFSGFFIAVMRLQPIVVTLSTMFIVQGITLLVMDKPGGAIPPTLGSLMVGDAIPGILPMPLVILAVLVALWHYLKSTRLGTAIYAVGSDAEAARSTGIRVPRVQLAVYVLANACYGLAGVFISAQTGAGDPLVGNPMLLQVFAAIVVGGTRLGGGRGSPLGSIVGSYVLMMVVNILLVLNVSAYYSTIAEGLILFLAVLSGALGRKAALATHLREIATRLRARRQSMLPHQLGRTDRRLGFVAMRGAARPAMQSGVRPPFWVRHRESLRYALPAYVCFALVVLATQLVLGNALFSWQYYDSLIVLSSFLAILALGQGAVILTGGLDLSLPWSIALCGILLAGMVKGSDLALIYALPTVLVVGCLIGLANGLGIVFLGLSPIVTTLATNGMLQGLALLYSNGTPDGFASPSLRWVMTERLFGVTPVVLFVIAFVVVATLVLSRTPFGRRIYGIGNSERAAMLSGIAVGRTLILVYVLSGFCCALVGSLLTGFSGQASLGMGDEYLLPSIAVVVVGGTLITGGRGDYLGMLGGVLLLTALQTLLAGTTVPYATRAILFGLVILSAVIVLRERQ